MPLTFNRIILVGRAGATPELRSLPDGQSVLTLSLATDRPGKRGTPSATDWHRVTCYERLAEVAAQHMTKGQAVFIEGRLAYRSWEDRQGQKRTSAEIVARELIVLDRPQHADAPAAIDGESESDELSDLPF
jgi:single-strand DNA-binding protein